MESFVQFICEHADDAHWIIFCLLMLAGLNVPFSEDLLILTGGVIASTCIPEHKWHLYTWIYFGTWLSAMEVYAIGRFLGPKLYDIRWFSRVISPERIDKLHHYYEKFGIFTFIFGRFIPGGIRNALFMSAGLGKMPFLKFIARDALAAFISSQILFSIGYAFGKNYHTLFHYFKKYNLIALAIVATLVVLAIVRFWVRRKSKGA